MAWMLGALGLLQLAAHASAIDPYDCTEGEEGANAAIQVLNPDSVPGDDYYVAQLQISSGKYDLLFKLPKDQIGYERVNSCGISPIDSKMYCLFDHGGVGYLARFDSTVDGSNAGIEYVAEAPLWGAAGCFGMNGDYYLVSGKKLMKIETPDLLPGQPAPDNSLPDLDRLPNAQSDLGFDVNAVVMDLDGSGEKGWAVSIKDGTVRAASEDGDFCEMTPSGDTLSGSFGAAWSYDGELYFSCNSGKGVFSVVLSDGACAPGETPQALVRRVGSSEKTSKNDGLNCMVNVPAPWPPAPAPTPAPTPAPVPGGEESSPEDEAEAMRLGAAEASESLWATGRAARSASRPGPKLAGLAAAGAAAALVLGSLAAVLGQRRRRRPAAAGALIATEEEEQAGPRAAQRDLEQVE